MTIKLTRVNNITITCAKFLFIFILTRLSLTDISYYSSHSSNRSGSIVVKTCPRRDCVVGGGGLVVVGGGGVVVRGGGVVVGGCVGG